MLGELKRGLLMRAESAHQYYTSEFILNLMKQEGKDVFTSRLNIPGHIQQVEIDQNLK